MLFANTPAQAKFLLYHLEQTPGGIGLYVNANKTQFICFKRGAKSTTSGKPLKLIDQFTHLTSNISSVESDVNICLGKSMECSSQIIDRVEI